MRYIFAGTRHEVLNYMSRYKKRIYARFFIKEDWMFNSKSTLRVGTIGSAGFTGIFLRIHRNGYSYLEIRGFDYPRRKVRIAELDNHILMTIC